MSESKKLYSAQRLALVFLVALSAGCSYLGGDVAQAAAPAAKVDGVTISQQSVIAAVPAIDEQRRRAQLASFVAEQLLANAALQAKLESDPAVVTALEIARRQALARAFLAKKAAALPRPSEAEIKAFYDEHPELFAQRRIYRLQEIAITAPADRFDEIVKHFSVLNTFNERAAWLTQAKLPFGIGVTVKPAEDIPADVLATLKNLKNGAAFNMQSAQGLTTVQITAAEDRPLTLAQAQADIERSIVNRQTGDLVKLETQRLGSMAKIEYFAPYLVKQN